MDLALWKKRIITRKIWKNSQKILKIDEHILKDTHILKLNILGCDMPPTNGWTNGCGESHLRHHVEGCFEEEFENMGRILASCGV
jgi:hypothetical protein